MLDNLYKTICARLLKPNFTKRLLCCLCLARVRNDCISVDDEIIINLRSGLPVTKPICDVLKYLLGESFSETMHVLKSVCKKCMTSVIDSYTFIQRCKVNTDILNEAVDNLKKSFEDIPDRAYDCKTMYVAIDPYKILDSSLVKRYYDKKRSNTTRQALTRFKRISSKKVSNCKSSSKAIETMEMIKDSTDHPNELKCKVCEEQFHSITSLRVHYFRVHLVSKDAKIKPEEAESEDIESQGMGEDNADDESDTEDPLACMKSQYSPDLETNQKDQPYPEVPLTVPKLKDLPTDEVYQCADCDLTFRSYPRYMRHKNQTKKCTSRHRGNYICDYCGRRYSYKALVARHISYKHFGVTKFICSECGKNCSSKSHLKNHRLQHTKEKNFVCPICGKAYQTETYLNYHITLHRTDTPFACEECGKCFKTHLLRTDHMKRTHLPPTYECEVCNRKFRDFTTLKRHRPRHYDTNSKLFIHRDTVPLDKKTYPCQYCDLVFTISGDRCKHVREMHKPPSAECDLCHRIYQLQRDVNRHRKLHFDVNSKYYLHKDKTGASVPKKGKKSKETSNKNRAPKKIKTKMI